MCSEENLAGECGTPQAKEKNDTADATVGKGRMPSLCMSRDCRKMTSPEEKWNGCMNATGERWQAKSVDGARMQRVTTTKPVFSVNHKESTG